ncbi:MAG: EAL domain-containing protein [Halioglobus sp.]
MNASSKITLLVLCVALAASIALTALVGQQSVAHEREKLLKDIRYRIVDQTDVQVAVYFNDGKYLQTVIDDLFKLSPAVRNVNIVDTQASTLKSRSVLWAPNENPRLGALREGTADTETSEITLPSELYPPGYGALAIITAGESVINLSIPVLSSVNPLEDSTTRLQFAESLTSAEGSKSAFVTGYINVSISNTLLRAQALRPVIWVALGGLIFVIACVVISIRVARKITGPISRLAKVADELASGQINQAIDVDGAGEFKEIASVLNSVIGGVNTYKSKMDVDHQLLSMKVDERTAQLSRRNEELNKAVEEVTETKNRLRRLAYFDSLTALPNRRLLTEQLDLLLKLAKRNKQILALLFLDLDNFKRINDSLGHSAGDQLLKEVARRLSQCVRESDVVAHNTSQDPRVNVSRLGGDEFTVVLNQIDHAESAGIVADRIIQSLVAPINIEGHDLVVTPSIGIAVAPADSDDVNGLLKAADTAMYHAKSSGKNSYLFYNFEMDATSVDRLKLESDLRKAIERKELLFHYQPQVDTRTGSVLGVEALLRWEHPEQGMVPPFKFIPLAEEMGLIGEIGAWGLREACRQLVEIRDAGLTLDKVSVNVSALQFNARFIAQVKAVLDEYQLSPDSLELELTEGIMIDDNESILAALHALKELGVRLSIDDFGTGYSSLSYLSKFPLDELKIDRSFVIELEKSESDAALVTAIIAMGKSLKLEIVAEGVETHAQYEFLTSRGATLIQGYLFSKPLPIHELKRVLYPSYFDEQIRKINLELENNWEE